MLVSVTVVFILSGVFEARTQTTPVLKCCPVEKIFDNGSCKNSSKTFILPPIYTWPSLIVKNDSQVNVTYGLPDCKTVMYYLDPHEDPGEQFRILETGALLRGDGRKDSFGDYCLDTIASEGEVRPVACFPADDEDPEDEETRRMFAVYPVGMLVSVPFLMATFIVYAAIKQLRNLHGACLMSHVASLIVSYLSLSTVQIASDKISPQFCTMTGFAVQFFFLATFFWLNVMCIDIYWAFSGIKSFRGSASERDRKKLLFYSAYAWGMPLLILSATVAIDYSDSIPESSHFKPNMGKDKCFFKNRIATWTYLYCPMALILFTNLVLFGITAFRIWRHRRETAVLQRGDSRRHDGNDSERFVLYLKLFSVMGINWLSELVSFMFGSEVPQYLWYITDITNTLQGVFIFLIFVWKKRVRKLLWDKMCKSSNKNKGTSTGINTTSSVLVLSS